MLIEAQKKKGRHNPSFSYMRLKEEIWKDRSHPLCDFGKVSLSDFNIASVFFIPLIMLMNFSE